MDRHRVLIVGAMVFGGFLAVMVTVFTGLLWFDPHRILGAYSAVPDTIDAAMLIRAKWVGNRILPFGVVMAWCLYKREIRPLGYLLLLRAGVDYLDALVLLTSLGEGQSPQAVSVAVGALVLGVTGTVLGVALLRLEPENTP